MAYALRRTVPVACGYIFLGMASVSYTHLDVYKRQRQGWSLAGLEGTDALLKEDGGGRRYRVLAHADAGLAEFSRHCEAEGWQLAASGDGAHVFEAVREVSGALDERGSRAYARGRCGRRALCWAALAAAVALAVLLLSLIHI